MLSGIHIPHNSLLLVEARELNALSDYQAAVGGYIEPIDIPDQRLTLIVNEDGKRVGIPVNARATILWWYLNPKVSGQDLLLGDVVLVGALVDAPENKAVPEVLVNLLLHTRRYRVEARFLGGASGWQASPQRFGSYFEAAIWALMLRARRLEVIEVRIIAA